MNGTTTVIVEAKIAVKIQHNDLNGTIAQLGIRGRKYAQRELKDALENKRNPEFEVRNVEVISIECRAGGWLSHELAEPTPVAVTPQPEQTVEQLPEALPPA